MGGDALLTKIKIKKNNNCNASKMDILSICSTKEVKVARIVVVTDGYLLFCSTPGDADKLFSDSVFAAFAGKDLEPVMPMELKANRAVIIKRVDDIIFDNDVDDIQHEIEVNNSWAKVKQVIKLTKSRWLKVVFSSTDMSKRCASGGILLFHLHVPSCDIFREQFHHILTCYRCYKFDHHSTFQCPNPKSYVICSICSSSSHIWRDCKSAVAKCINCSGSHSTLSKDCPIKSKALREKRLGVAPQTYSQAATKMPPQQPVLNTLDKSILAKSYSCIVLALFKNDDVPGSFSDTVNSLFALNGLPSLNLGDYSPPSIRLMGNSTETALNELPKSDHDERTAGEGGDLPPEHTVTDLASSSLVDQSHSDGSLKVFKRKTTSVNDGSELLTAWSKGDVVVTDDRGTVTDGSLIETLQPLTRDQLKPLLVDLKPAEFEKIKGPIARDLRTRGPKNRPI